ncbi:hypothetical protein D9M71_502740 [compost metagenome]
MQVDGKHRDAVVAAVGGVEKTPAAVHFNFRGAAVAGVGRGQRRQHLQRLQRTGHGIEAVAGDGGIQFVDGKGIGRLGVQRDMPWPGAFAAGNEGLLGRVQLAVVEVEAEHPVQAFVRHQHKLARGIERIEMRLGERLLDPVRPDRAFQLHQLADRAQAAIGLHVQHRQGAGNVVGHHHVALARVQRQVHRVAAFATDGIEQGQAAIVAVDGEGADFAAIAMHAVQPVTGTVEGQERRVDQVADHLHTLQGARLLVHLVDRDAVTPGIALARSARTDIGKHWVILPLVDERWPLLRQQRPARWPSRPPP